MSRATESIGVIFLFVMCLVVGLPMTLYFAQRSGFARWVKRRATPQNLTVGLVVALAAVGFYFFRSVGAAFE